MPELCGSREITASLRRASIVDRSWVKVSGCWSYLVEMYCFMGVDRRRGCVRRKGMGRMLLLAMVERPWTVQDLPLDVDSEDRDLWARRTQGDVVVVVVPVFFV